MGEDYWVAYKSNIGWYAIRETGGLEMDGPVSDKKFTVFDERSRNFERRPFRQ